MESLKLMLYDLKPQPRTRTVPLEIIAVGISRSGTESLREALVKLGFDHCYHGWDSAVEPRQQIWYSLIKKKYGTPGGHCRITAKDFDQVIGHCRAITDLPAAFFARDLIEAYPDAKVLLNHRDDIDAWYRSFEATMGQFDGDKYDMRWVKSWFCAELFWIQECIVRNMIPFFFRGSFACNGKWVYEDHVAMIRGLGLPPGKLLEWTVQEGWQPLSHFLGREVPDEPFPSGNTPADYAEKLPRLLQEYDSRANRNMTWVGASVVVPMVVCVLLLLAGCS